jgi:hypothetical protein
MQRPRVLIDECVVVVPNFHPVCVFNRHLIAYMGCRGFQILIPRRDPQYPLTAYDSEVLCHGSILCFALSIQEATPGCERLAALTPVYSTSDFAILIDLGFKN